MILQRCFAMGDNYISYHILLRSSYDAFVKSSFISAYILFLGL